MDETAFKVDFKGRGRILAGTSGSFADVKEEMSGKAECRLWLVPDAVEKEEG